jgi:uncharacterized membrane protein YdbT with pleckstrin-like domain
MIAFDKDEKILWEGKPLKRVWFPWIVKYFFISLLVAFFIFYAFRTWSWYVLFGAGVFWLISLIYAYALIGTHHYYITDQRVVFEGGILISKKHSMPFSKITDVEISKNIIEQACRISSAGIYSPGTGSDPRSRLKKPDILFEGIADPDVPRRILFENIMKQVRR